ncbi:MAG: ArsC/Spx/MgsR family protein [Pseudomonadota bacterium]
MDVTLFGLKTCDTCRKAIKALEAAGHAVTVRDVRADGVPAGDLSAWVAEHGEALVNTRSTTWRGLDEATRARKDADAVGLLADHPTLIKRPVVLAGGTIHVGWTKDVQAALL